ncbi:GNAT family N-acetyltransferase [Chelatococcus reniformis]|uniref:N-acetyltransferase n=1 Tax=Chelatococcus reniformis TaxID=1494448 RepID=A0A916U7X7_9HYPH|nr:N-acetyltransferase [Chelatococcus reniformis]GGC61869.1 N-acetyltransferase [Chelatococcus reniformis]
MIVRAEEPGDRRAIRAVLEAAFPTPAEAGLVDRLRADGNTEISLVAVDEGAIVGHVMFSRIAAEFRALGLAPVAVLPTRQRSGIGSRLIRSGLARAEADLWRLAFVLGDPPYYRRFGFDPALASGFTSPYAGPYFMALALTRPLPPLSGRIDYAPAFAALA